MLLLAAVALLPAAGQREAAVTIDTTVVLNRFDPAIALGAGIGGQEEGQVKRKMPPANIAAMRTAGLKPLVYRLRTELAGEAWHWNPEGTWSDAAHRQGYWVSSPSPGAPIELAYGYRLPRRGNTGDQANNDGYSRLADGDPASFWKSNPYLDRHFTGEDNAAHPQWVAIDLGRHEPLDSLRVLWGTPYATALRVEYAPASTIDVTAADGWKTFPLANAVKGTGGDQTIALASQPVSARYVRLLMTAFSGTAPAGSTDVRDGLGVAIREVYVGTGSGLRFMDQMRHSPGRFQTVMHVSSTDPWHRATDRDPKVEQPGFDFFFRGLAGRIPVLMAVPVLYDVPENPANLVRWLAARKYTVTHAALGQAPEEQSMRPEDFGALYVQWSKAVRAANPRLSTGGPGIALLRADRESDPSWTKRFVAWLRSRNALAQLRFFSFDWYPFDEVCQPPAPQVAAAPGLLTEAVARLWSDGVPRTLPLFLTAYGYSSYASEAGVTLPGAIVNADIAAGFLSLGGARAYLDGYEPDETVNDRGCSWGNNILFHLGEDGKIRSRTPAYYAARLLSTVWASPRGGLHKVYAAKVPLEGVSAYALERPEGLWSLLLVNRDAQRSVRVRLPLRGVVDVAQYGTAQYRWARAGADGHAVEDQPPVASETGTGEVVTLPPYSITIARGAY